jgi:hypothetical protein
VKPQETNNGRIRARLQRGPRSTEELSRELRIGHSSTMMAVRSLKRRKQIHGSHEQWSIAEWCDTEEKFHRSVIARTAEVGRAAQSKKRDPAVVMREQDRAAMITRGVNTAILSWR